MQREQTVISVKGSADRNVLRESELPDEPSDLSLIVADKHGGIALHNGRRQRLEVTPEVAQSHVLGIT